MSDIYVQKARKYKYKYLKLKQKYIGEGGGGSWFWPFKSEQPVAAQQVAAQPVAAQPVVAQPVTVQPVLNMDKHKKIHNTYLKQPLPTDNLKIIVDNCSLTIEQMNLPPQQKTELIDYYINNCGNINPNNKQNNLPQPTDLYNLKYMAATKAGNHESIQKLQKEILNEYMKKQY
jgi:hypothetical protein